MQSCAFLKIAIKICLEIYNVIQTHDQLTLMPSCFFTGIRITPITQIITQYSATLQESLKPLL